MWVHLSQTDTAAHSGVCVLLLPRLMVIQGNVVTHIGMQGEMLPIEEMVELRTAVVKADDLRKPSDLKDQVGAAISCIPRQQHSKRRA